MSADLPGSPASTGLADRAKAIVMQPKAEWPRIAAETTEPTQVLTGYVLPLALIGPVATLIGSQVFGYSFLGVTVRPDLASAVGTAVVTFVLSLVSLFVVAFVANYLSPKFGGKESFPAAFRLVAYAWTAAWLAGIFGLVPSLAILGLVGLYSLYLFYLGAGPVMSVPADKATGYTVVTVLVAIAVNIVVGLVAAGITGGLGASAIAADDVASVDFGNGAMRIEAGGETIELGDARIEVEGDTAKVTVGDQEVEVRVDEAR